MGVSAGWGNSPTNDPAERRTSGDEGEAGADGGTMLAADAPGGNQEDNVNREDFDAKYEAMVAADGNQPTPKRGPTGMRVPSID